MFEGLQGRNSAGYSTVLRGKLDYFDCRTSSLVDSSRPPLLLSLFEHFARYLL